MPTIKIHCSYDDHLDPIDGFVYLSVLQTLSSLQALVLSDAPLKMIRLVYEADPSAMNDDVFLDACRHSKRCDVIQFLKELVEPSVYSPAKIARIMLELFENDHSFDDENFVTLFKMFPEAAYYNDLPGQVSGPFRAMFTNDYWGDKLHDEVRCDMIRHIPGDIKLIKIGSLDRNREAESNIECRSLLVTKLKDLKNLQELELPVDVGDKTDQNLVEAICHLILLGPLKTLRINSSGFDDDDEEQEGDSEGKDKQSGFFLPILDAIAVSGSNSKLKHLSLPDFDSHAAAGGYRDRMIEILQWNTSLTDVGVGYVSHWSDEPSLGYKEALIDQPLIDHYTTMNEYGRGLVRDPKTTLWTIVDLLEKATASYRDFVRRHPYRGKRTLYYMKDIDLSTVRVLNGLLREAPGKWSDIALDEDKNKNKKPSAKSQPNRKRKASHSLD
ncbi:expressed unknown protein [Seminavis robusta]|uniref:Uncharacterized protein n=1 Tax=Seminavis robusta TaxID=568900 RepID=A0A9N8E2U1_9STRA|nr:expressed unknown protein [Seminavis robusta]|eukprot:Sro598_g173070.1 n/a (442) ;mRNA; r:46435-47760